MKTLQRQPWLAWAAVGLLAVLCGTLAVLQYRWIGEITEAESGKLHGDLQSRLNALGRAFNQEISNAAYALFPPNGTIEELGREKAYAAQYARWKESRDHIFRRIALAVPEPERLALLELNLDTAQWTPTEWPPEWRPMQMQLEERRQGVGGMGQTLAAGPVLLEMPRFGPGGPGRGGREQEWLLVELNVEYVRGALLPELLNRYLGYAGKIDYAAQLVERADPSQLIYASHPGEVRATEGKADAVVSLLEVQPNGRGRGPDGRRGPGVARPGPPPGPPPPLDRGRWQLQVRHNAGSIEALVERTRRKNLAISGGVLALIAATMFALVRLSRRAQQLADLQVQFVAGVSHELRTPLTVIRTAAFNLKGRMANQPEQVQKYGSLIQSESEKLTALVEQILQFASTAAGHAIRAKEPVALQGIANGLRFSLNGPGSGQADVEQRIAADLPLIMADEVALRQALQNLVDNALKYATESSNWIGLTANRVAGGKGQQIEIRVTDHGPGIPAEEQSHIFDPFFRGSKAVRDQVHGSGLGLYLVKKIVEAHGGSIRVISEPLNGTEFVIRIPAAPPELQDEFAHTAD